MKIYLSGKPMHRTKFKPCRHIKKIDLHAYVVNKELSVHDSIYVFIGFSSSPAYAAAKASLLRQYRGSFRTVTIPCYVASGKCGNPGELPYRYTCILWMKQHECY